MSSSVIYGPNAVGKTNIIGAIDVLRAIIIRGNMRMRVFALYERYKAGETGNKEFQDQRLKNLKLQEICQKQLEQYGKRIWI